MINLLAIGVGGFFGSLSRYWISGLLITTFGTNFPVGTMGVNLFGSFLLGMAMSFQLNSQMGYSPLFLGITVGFLGAFTTFSTFSFETMHLLKNGSHLLGLLNIAGNVIICLLASTIGYLLLLR